MTANLFNEDAFDEIFRTPRPVEQKQAEQIDVAADAERCAGCFCDCTAHPIHVDEELGAQVRDYEG